MASADRELTILLKLLADTAGATQVRAQLTALQAEQQKLQTQASSIGATELSTTQATAAAQQVLNGIMERRVIMETQLEAAEARIAGNPAMAAKLEREVAIRTQALTIQRTLNVTTEESIVLAERMVIAQEATSVATSAAGINMSKLKFESMQLGRELATGTVTMRTISALIGSLGTSLTIAGIGAFELYQGFQSAEGAAEETSKAAQKLRDDARSAFGVFEGAADKSRSLGDVANMADRVATDLTKMSTDMAAFRARELTGWQVFWQGVGNLAHLGMTGILSGGATDDFYTKALAEDKARSERDYNTQLERTGIQLLDATKHAEAFQLALAKPAEFLPIYQQKLADGEAALQKARKALEQSYQSTTPVSAETRDALIKGLEDTAIKLQTTRGDVDKLTAALKKTSEEGKEFNAFLRDTNTLIAGIRQQQQLINSAPFLSADEKQVATIQKTRQEIVALAAAITKTKDAIEHSALDPAQAARAAAELENLKFHTAELKQSLSALTDPIRADLTSWVNQWGTASHQIATTIENTIGAALNEVNNYILTGQFNSQQLLQTIARLGLELLEHLLLQRIMTAVNASLATGQAAVTGPLVAAAWAPAATLVSIATEGQADLQAPAAIAAALTAVEGLAFLATGGMTGPRPHLAVVGEEGPEFVFTHRATKNIGAENLYAMMHAAESAPRFGLGGVAGPWTEPPILPGNRGGPYLPYTPNWMGPASWTGGEPTIDFGFGERPIFHWPYGGPNQGGYIVQTSKDIYPGDDDDVTDVPPIVASNPYGLPVDPGADPGPGLFPRPPGGVTIIPTAGYRPGGYAATPNYIGNFGGNFSLPFFPGWSGLGYGTRPPVEAGSVFTANNPPTYNSSLGIWQQWDPVAQTMIQAPPPTRFDPGFIDPATGLVIAPSGSASGGSAPSSIVNPPSSPTIGTHWDFTQGRYVANNNATGAQFNSQAANALMMWYQSMGGNPNLAQPDIPSTFQSGVWQLDPESGAFTQVGDRSARDPRWVFPSQSESARLGLSFTNNAKKSNDWLIAHNPWFYDQIPGGADGARIPGPASRADNILSWLSTGERVIPADRNIMLERAFGFDWDRKLEVAMPRFANGGRVARGAMASASGAPAEGDVHVYIFDDRRKAQHAYEESPHARKVFRDRLNRYG